MLNVYSCGCTAVDVPILSRCAEHDGHVVVVSRSDVPREQRASKMSEDRQLVYLYDSLSGGLSRLRDESVGLVFTYPDHFPFAAREALGSKEYMEFPDLYFRECKRVLRKDGHIVLFVEHFVQAAVVYAARMSGFIVNSVSLVRMKIKSEPLSPTFLNDFHVYKSCIVLSRSGSAGNIKLGNVSLSKSYKLIDKLYNGGLILDTSCIHSPFALVAKQHAKTVGIVSDNARYKALLRSMDK